MFAPLNVAAFLYIPRQMRGAAVGLLAVLRNEGGSFGTSMEQTLQERRNQFHTVDGLSVFYREAGPKDAPTLLLLHGFPSSSRMYEPLLTRLSGH